MYADRIRPLGSADPKMRTPLAPATAATAGTPLPGTQFACFTGTNVRILTQRARTTALPPAAAAPSTYIPAIPANPSAAAPLAPVGAPAPAAAPLASVKAAPPSAKVTPSAKRELLMDDVSAGATAAAATAAATAATAATAAIAAAGVAPGGSCCLTAAFYCCDSAFFFSCCVSAALPRFRGCRCAHAFLLFFFIRLLFFHRCFTELQQLQQQQASVSSKPCERGTTALLWSPPPNTSRR